MTSLPSPTALRSIVRGSIALILVGAFVAACFCQVTPEALTALAGMAGGATAFYFGEDSQRNSVV